MHANLKMPSGSRTLFFSFNFAAFAFISPDIYIGCDHRWWDGYDMI
jgi:hypothetical protein